MKSRLCVLSLGVMLMGMAPVSARGDDVILNPGTVSGSISVAGRQITSVTVRAIDTERLFSGTVAVNASPAADSINYVLTLEGGRSYYVMALARVAGTVYGEVLFPVSGPVSVPVDGNASLDLPLNPAIISGTIWTGSSAHTINRYLIRIYISTPEFGSNATYYTSASGLDVPGNTGVDYSLLAAPGTACHIEAYAYVNDKQYYFGPTRLTTPASGVTFDRDYKITVTDTASTVSGSALLLGTDVTTASVHGIASLRSSEVIVSDLSTGSYTLEVDAGIWRLRPRFSFNLPGELSDLTGELNPPYSEPMNIGAGEELTDVDFVVDPGFIPGTLNLWGANTNFVSARVGAGQSDTFGGTVESGVAPDTGEFLMVCSPGAWQADYYQRLDFDYPDDPDPSLYSYIERYGSDAANTRIVAAGEATPSVDLTFGTITVRRFFYVAGGGTLSHPSIGATCHESPSSSASGSGSSSPTTEGQAIVTLLLPGTYTINARAKVNGSHTAFAPVDVTVEEGDIVVIGGTDRPTVQVTSPTNEETVCGKKVTVEGTIADDHGIASITINGEDVAFDPNENPVHFSHEVVLTLGENLITLVVADTDHTEPVVLTFTVFSEDCGNPCPVVTLTSPSNGQTVNSNTIVVEGNVTDDVGIASIKINGEEVPFEPVLDPNGDDGETTVHFSQQIGIDCGENTITIVVTDMDQAEPNVTTLTVNSTACAIQVPIDIYPNRVPNKVYLSTNYTIYVALLGAEEFAVTDVNSSTVRFGRTGTEASPVREPAIRDINADGFDDALYGFLTFDCGFELGDNTGNLTGQIAGEIPIAGSDSVSVLE